MEKRGKMQERWKKVTECFAGFEKSCIFAPQFRGKAFEAP